jgi:hypothetical protein
VLEPTLVVNPHFPSQSSVDWSDPEVAVTVGGDLQPTSVETATQAGLDARREWWSIYCDPVVLTPEGRVRVLGVVYRVMRVRSFPSHTFALVERIDTVVEEGSLPSIPDEPEGAS